MCILTGVPTKVLLVKVMVFPVVMYGCETIKKAEHQRTDAFELWFWRLHLRVPWLQEDPTSPSWRKLVLNIHWKNWCWSWNSNTLATWCEELTHWKRLWFWERLKVEEEGDDRGWDGWKASPTQWTWVSVGSRDWWRTGKPYMGHKELDVTEQLNWTEQVWGDISLWFWLSFSWCLVILNTIHVFVDHLYVVFVFFFIDGLAQC